MILSWNLVENRAGRISGTGTGTGLEMGHLYLTIIHNINIHNNNISLSGDSH